MTDRTDVRSPTWDHYHHCLTCHRGDVGCCLPSCGVDVVDGARLSGGTICNDCDVTPWPTCATCERRTRAPLGVCGICMEHPERIVAGMLSAIATLTAQHAHEKQRADQAEARWSEAIRAMQEEATAHAATKATLDAGRAAWESTLLDRDEWMNMCRGAEVDRDDAVRSLAALRAELDAANGAGRLACTDLLAERAAHAATRQRGEDLAREALVWSWALDAYNASVRDDEGRDPEAVAMGYAEIRLRAALQAFDAVPKGA